MNDKINSLLEQLKTEVKNYIEEEVSRRSGEEVTANDSQPEKELPVSEVSIPPMPEPTRLENNPVTEQTEKFPLEGQESTQPFVSEPPVPMPNFSDLSNLPDLPGITPVEENIDKSDTLSPLQTTDPINPVDPATDQTATSPEFNNPQPDFNTPVSDLPEPQFQTPVTQENGELNNQNSVPQVSQENQGFPVARGLLGKVLNKKNQ